MGLAVIDSSVLIALLDDHDTHHDPARETIAKARAKHTLVIPVVAFAETLVQPYRRNRTDGRTIEDKLHALGRIEPLSAPIGSRAAQLRAATRLKIPDALILATGLELSARHIYTCDEQWKSIHSTVTCLAA